ncbi:MAG: hypothetical protein AAGK97_00580 [Bacteroidota bacterium]
MASNFKLPFFKIPKHQKFNYKPRFYDAEREDLEKRVQRAKNSQGESLDAVKSRISSKLRSGGYADSSVRRKYQRRSSLITFGIIIVLLALACYIIIYYLPDFIKAIEQG